MKNWKSLIYLSLFSFILFACKSDDDDKDNNSICEEWGYGAINGPLNWSNCYSECAGTVQSPIDIQETTQNNSLESLTMSYQPTTIELENNGHTVEQYYNSGSSIIIDGITYQLEQFHFHTPSEHTINGVHYPMEIHLVHEDPQTSNLVVIGILVQEGQENSFLSQFFNDLPKTKDERYSSQNIINIKDALPSNAQYYTYSGSLTTPPCSEIATWFVYQNPIEASSSQITSMHEILGNNNRPVQPLNGRTVYQYNP
ncbi:carbonate dehydratase [Flavobacteriaceae bacterium UJ101]|nr:carbonate dehydratase [Flavobacteriaceae bacterium UJ101]